MEDRAVSSTNRPVEECRPERTFLGGCLGERIDRRANRRAADDRAAVMQRVARSHVGAGCTPCGVVMILYAPRVAVSMRSRAAARIGLLGGGGILEPRGKEGVHEVTLRQRWLNWL